ncbi:MAG: NAD+ synthase, partial [Bryobacteraceae bacterium]|nr:NAD+ synthase [Bryobacteraceae bacterium]
MRIALGQIDTTVGDLAGNVDRMVRFAKDAAGHGAELIVFPELSVTGYPPRDLLEKDAFIEKNLLELERLAAETASLDIAIISGYAGRANGVPGKQITNSAAIIEKGRVIFRQDKMLLPTYDVFDEARYFYAAERQAAVNLRGRKIALTICEDARN